MRAFSLVRQHGWNATAFQTLERGYSYFFHGDDAYVAYVDTGSAWVAAGAPIAPEAKLRACSLAFMQAARAARRRSCFFATEARFQHAMGDSLRALCIGEQPSWDPRTWPEIVSAHKSLREQLRRARAKHVLVRRLNDDELEHGPTREAMNHLIRRWLSTRGMAPMGFLVRVEPFTFPAHRAAFVAEIDGRMVAFAGVIPVPARNGWFIEDLVRDPSSPNGTSELLIDAVMSWAAAEGCDWLTLGLSPLAGNVPTALRFARRTGKLLYDFDGLRSYKAKLRPNSWSPIHLAHPPSQSTWLSMLDALSAFTRGGFVRFGARTLVHRSLSIVR